MNMTQPDPAGLFEPIRKKQQQATNPAADSSVIAQLQNRPAPAVSLPSVNAADTPATPPVSNNPLVAMSQSGQLQALLKAKAEQLANQPPLDNPIVELAKNGGIRQLVLAKEDQQYQQALAEWEKPEKIVPLAGTSYLTKEQKRPMPQPPARDFNQIEQDWNRGIHQLRGSEFANMLNLLETGQMTPEQEAKITANIEPMLEPETRRDLQIARLARDKYQQLQADYKQQMKTAGQIGEQVAEIGGPVGWAAKQLGYFSPRGMEARRGMGRGASFQYAFTPNEERLNSPVADIAADERAKRNFYLNEQRKYPIASMAGNMLGAMLPISGGISQLRHLRMANALKAGPPTQATAAMVARGGAPATTTGIVAEGVAVGLPYDLASRPIGAENMTLEENLQGRAHQAGFGLALGPIADIGLTKGIPLLARGAQWTGGKVSNAVNSVVKVQQKKGLDKAANELGYKDFDEFADAATEIVTDETGSRIRLKPDILNGFSEADQARAGNLLNQLNPEATHVPGASPVTPAEPTFSRVAQDKPDETQFPALKPDTEQSGPIVSEPAAPTATATADIEETPGAGRLAAGEAEPVVTGRTKPDLTAAEPPPGKAKIQGLQVVEAPVSELTLSRDVPQFKSGADESGVVEPLGGTFDRTGVAPIQVWVRNDGRHEVISGRHRLDLARRSGEETIPAQYHYESEGFGQQQAATLDALLNIREGQGKVKDYVDYIKGSELTEEAAHAEGILGRATGQRAYAIATNGSDTLIAAHRNNGLSDDAAARIANAAPGNERLQAVGIKAKANGKSTAVAENMVKAVRSMTDNTGSTSSLDMFGFDDSAIREAEQLARQAGRKQDDIQKTLSAVKGASKNPTLAAKEGVDIHDPDALKRRISELEAQKAAWKNWHTNPDLVTELRSDLGLSSIVKSTEPEPQAEVVTTREVPENQGGFFDEFDLTQPTARELEARDRVQQEAAAREQQEQAALAAKTRADAEVEEFELGIQGSGLDVSSKQRDMGGWFRTAKEETVTQPSQKIEPSVDPVNGKRTLYRRGHREGRWWSDDKSYTELYKESATHKDEVADVDFDNLKVWDTVNDPNGSARIFDEKTEDEMAEIIRSNGFDAARMEGEDGQNIFFLAKNVDEISQQSLKPTLEPHPTQPSLKTEAETTPTTLETSGAQPPKEPPAGTSLYSTPIIPAAREVANLLHLNPGGAIGGAVYGGIAAGDKSQAERYSPQWWLDSVFGATSGAMAGALGSTVLRKVPIKGRALIGEEGWGKQAINFMGEKIGKIPGFGVGDKEVTSLKKQQKLLKALIERQAEKSGQYLLENFTPSQRAAMSDLIEQRGIIAEGNLLHRQAKELDDFIAYTANKMQDLSMLDDTIEPGGYLHRYYAKDLGITGLMRGLIPGGKTMSGSWSRRRGTQEIFDRRYMSQSMRATLDEVQNLIVERDGLKKQARDLVGADTQGRIDEINAQLKELQSIEFREYTAIENGKLKSFFLHPDEVPIIPGLQRTGTAGLPEPIRQGTLEGMEQPRTIDNTGQLALTDRRWTIDGKDGEKGGILHRDWTKAERESWGEIHDAAYRMVRGQAEVAHDLSLGIFYKQVVDRFQGTKVSDSAIEGWYQVPNVKIGAKSRLKKYGALAGKYVTPEVWAAIKHHGRNPLLNWTNNHPAVKNYLKLLSKWKAYKTVYNPVSHVNNTVGNLGMYYMSDYSPKYLGSAIKELHKGENSALYREARDNGLFGTDFTTTLNIETGQKKLDELLEKLRNQPEIPDLNETLDTLMSIKQWFIESKNAVSEARGPWQTGVELAAAVGNPFVNAAKKPINKAADAMQAAYRMEDEFFKMAVYVAERQKGTKPFDAVKAANKYFFDYSEMPTAFQAVRDSPIGSPFISYTYFAVPALARTAVERPEKLFAFAAFLEGINYAGMAINDELQEQGYWDQMAEDESVLPSWMQGRSLFGGLNNISIPYVDSYKLGLANMLPAGNPFIGNAEREGAFPAALSFWGPGPEGSNPMARLLFDISNNRDWRGSQIYNPDSPSNAEKVRKGLNYIYQNITPSNPLFPGSYSQQKIIEGAANDVRLAEQEGEAPNMLLNGIVDMANATAETLGGGQFTGLDRADNEILFRDAIYGAMGIKRRPVRIEQFAEFKMSDLNKKRKGLSQWLARHEIDYGENRITKAQIERYRQQYEAKNQEYEEKAGKIEAAR